MSYWPVHHTDYESRIFQTKNWNENSYFSVEWYEINGIKYEMKSLVLYKGEEDNPIF